jgi:hypothetical protein
MERGTISNKARNWSQIESAHRLQIKSEIADRSNKKILADGARYCVQIAPKWSEEGFIN